MSRLSRAAATLTLTAGMCLATGAAWAQKITINMLKADSVQTFSEDALFSFETTGVVVAPKGNTSEAGGSYSFAISDITIGQSKYVGLAPATVKGSSSGSALEIWGLDENTGAKIGVTLANFQIDYHAKLVLADVTPQGGTTTVAAPLYTFEVKRPLGFVKLPDGRTVLQEVLGNLRLTPFMQRTFTRALNLADFAAVMLPAIDFGTLTQTIDLSLRAKAVSTAPYVPQP